MRLKTLHKNRCRKNKKGQSILDVFIFIAVAIIIVVLFAVWKFGINKMSTAIINVETPINNIGINISDAGQKTFGNLDNGMSVLNLVGLCMIVGMILTIFISNFLVKSHPVFFVGFIFVTILAIILSVFISNSYETLITSSDLGAIMLQSKATTTIMLNLPIWVTIIGLIGGFILFAGITRDEGQGGGLG